MSPSSTAPTVVFVHAHPDDEAIFTGLTMRRVADRGGRVILVTATAGEEGRPRIPLPRGTSVGARRLDELERSCRELNVDRLVLLGHRDSGMAGWSANGHRRALHRSDVIALAHRVAGIVSAEGASAVVHDDSSGIYGHPDHLAAHRIGAAAAALAGVSAYETTVDRDHLTRVDRHVVSRAAGTGYDEVGRTRDQIGLALEGTGAELAAKSAAMAAHASQIDPALLDPGTFGEVYGTEWFTRTRGPAVLEPLTAEHLVPRVAVDA
jgi:LmbE family N-acetylglucosaminyl deacetylase